MAITFGFLDARRPDRENVQLYLRLRSNAIASFRNEGVCDLKSFETDTIERSNQILCGPIGLIVSKLRDDLIESSKDRNIPIRFPDIQSFFLYSFTIGVNHEAVELLPPEGRVESPPATTEDILNRHYPLECPQWFCNATNAEMPALENVFCDFQNNILVPMAKGTNQDQAMFSDSIAGSFLWALLGGVYWAKEAVEELAESVFSTGGLDKIPPLGAYHVKRQYSELSLADIQQVLRVAELIAERDPDRKRG